MSYLHGNDTWVAFCCFCLGLQFIILLDWLLHKTTETNLIFSSLLYEFLEPLWKDCAMFFLYLLNGLEFKVVLILHWHPPKTGDPCHSYYLDHSQVTDAFRNAIYVKMWMQHTMSGFVDSFPDTNYATLTPAFEATEKLTNYLPHVFCLEYMS